ncbi:UNVERIFIED_CONTAM: hypothetical protein FKN15_002877 [Acipenser sinensis]
MFSARTRQTKPSELHRFSLYSHKANKLGSWLILASASSTFKYITFMSVLQQDNGASTQNSGEDKTLQSFLSWCKEVRLELSEKVYVSREGTVADYGMLAREEIEEGEVIFSIPRAALLNQSRTAIHSILEKEEESLKSQSGWVPLLLALMFEYTNSKSHWSPYLSLWTDFRALDHPMFW